MLSTYESGDPNLVYTEVPFTGTFVHHYKLTFPTTKLNSRSQIAFAEVELPGMLYSSTRIVTLPLQEVGNNGLPYEVFPLGQCQGDCDSKADCQVCIKKTWLVYYHFISFQ